MAFVCSQRSERQSMASPYGPPFLLITFPLSSISLIDLFFTSLPVACWIFHNGLVLLPLKVRLMRLSGPKAVLTGSD